MSLESQKLGGQSGFELTSQWAGLFISGISVKASSSFIR